VLEYQEAFPISATPQYGEKVLSQLRSDRIVLSLHRVARFPTRLLTKSLFRLTFPLQSSLSLTFGGDVNLFTLS